eukprot:gene8184-9627_t
MSTSVVTKKVGVIMGSTRANRLGEQIADWVIASLPKQENVSYEKVDLRTWNLPYFDEPQHPRTGIYSMDSTKAWSQYIAQIDSFIFITPQYNLSIPGALKNAIDHLSGEWANKPTIIISYGYRGANLAAEDLTKILNRGLKMKTTTSQPQITIAGDMFDADNKFKDIATSFASYTEIITKAHSELVGLLFAAPVVAEPAVVASA